MSRYGFVYLLGNHAMPCYFKIGCTERAPHQRAEELSAGTAIPQPFQVLCYIEVDNFQREEQRLHQELGDFRVSSNREFFMFGPSHMHWLRCIFRDHHYKSAYTECDFADFAPQPFQDVAAWTVDGEYLHMPDNPPIERGALRLIA